MCVIFRNETSMVNLQLLRKNKNGETKKVEQVVYGREYTLRADISKADGKMFFHLQFYEKLRVLQLKRIMNQKSYCNLQKML